MWDYLSPQNLMDFQRKAAIEQLDQEIAEDYANGYGVEADLKLERRFELKRLMEQSA